MGFLLDNYKAIVDKKVIDELKSSTNIEELDKHSKEVLNSNNDPLPFMFKNVLYLQLDDWIKENGSAFSKKRCSPFSMFSEAVKEKHEVSDPHKLSKSTGRSKKSKYAQKLWSQANKEIKDG